jgi:hypothetical protein
MNTKIDEFDFPVYGESNRFNVSNFQNWHKSILKLFNYCRTLSEEGKNKYINELSHYLRVDIPDHTTDDFSPLTWTQIKEMSQNKIVFGSHTKSHPILTRINIDVLFNELSESKKEIENILGIGVKHFCYPNGKKEDYNNNTIKMLNELSYVSSVTTIPGYNTFNNQNIYDLRRIVWTTDDKIDLKHILSSNIFLL